MSKSAVDNWKPFEIATTTNLGKEECEACSDWNCFDRPCYLQVVAVSDFCLRQQVSYLTSIVMLV